MKKTNSTKGAPKYTSAQKKEIVAVKKILGAISESKFAYDEKKEKIDFEVVLIGLSSEDIDDVITIFSAFCNLKESTKDAISLKDLTIFMDRCYATLDMLNNVAGFGNIYHEIITRFYINKEFPNIDEAAAELNVGSRNTFIARSHEAMLQLYNIWRCSDKGCHMKILKKILDSIED